MIQVYVDVIRAFEDGATERIQIGMIRLTIHFSGRVQGVGFRNTTEHIARRFAVSGYVQNLHDGRVLLVAEGKVDEVQQFLDHVTGQMKPLIKRHTVDRSPATGEFGTPSRDPLTIRW